MVLFHLANVTILNFTCSTKIWNFLGDILRNKVKILEDFCKYDIFYFCIKISVRWFLLWNLILKICCILALWQGFSFVKNKMLLCKLFYEIFLSTGLLCIVSFVYNLHVCTYILYLYQNYKISLTFFLTIQYFFFFWSFKRFNFFNVHF